MLTYLAIHDRSKGVHGGSANVARAAMVRAERVVADVSAEIMGPFGLAADTIADRQHLSGLVAGVASGTYEIQLSLIASLDLQLPNGRD